MIGAGGPIAVGLSAYFGRLPVLFWWMMIAVATAAWNAGAHGYRDFLASRVLNGFFATVAQGVSFLFPFYLLLLSCEYGYVYGAERHGVIHSEWCTRKISRGKSHMHQIYITESWVLTKEVDRAVSCSSKTCSSSTTTPAK